MRLAVTGTPGTGKTTATDALSTDLEVIHLNDVIEEHDFSTGVDTARETAIADFEAISEWLDGRDDVVIESHLAHHFDSDKVVVLRCHPSSLRERLLERGEPDRTAKENAESEALDIILAEAVERHGESHVYEIDTTDRTPEAVARDIEAVITGEREPSAGTVSFIDFL